MEEAAHIAPIVMEAGYSQFLLERTVPGAGRSEKFPGRSIVWACRHSTPVTTGRNGCRCKVCYHVHISSSRWLTGLAKLPWKAHQLDGFFVCACEGRFIE